MQVAAGTVSVALAAPSGQQPLQLPEPLPSFPLTSAFEGVSPLPAQRPVPPAPTSAAAGAAPRCGGGDGGRGAEAAARGSAPPAAERAPVVVPGAVTF